MTAKEDWKEKLDNFYDDKVNMNVYRNLFHLKKDPFNDYEEVKQQIDHDKISCMAYAIKDISKQCFKECINIKLNDYPQEEQKCIRNCIESQIKGMHLIIKKFERYQSKRIQQMHENESQSQ